MLSGTEVHQTSSLPSTQPAKHTAQPAETAACLLGRGADAGGAVRILLLAAPQVGVQPALAPGRQRLRRHHLAQRAGAHGVRLQAVEQGKGGGQGHG